MAGPPITPRFKAGIDLLRRTGMTEFQLRYSGAGDEAEDPPIAWIAVAVYTTNRWDCAAAVNCEIAVMRLCEQLIDGGLCTHCKRMTVFDADSDDTINEMMSDGAACWYMWDPELATFRRGCE